MMIDEPWTSFEWNYGHKRKLVEGTNEQWAGLWNMAMIHALYMEWLWDNNTSTWIVVHEIPVDFGAMNLVGAPCLYGHEWLMR